MPGVSPFRRLRGRHQYAYETRRRRQQPLQLSAQLCRRVPFHCTVHFWAWIIVQGTRGLYRMWDARQEMSLVNGGQEPPDSGVEARF